MDDIGSPIKLKSKIKKLSIYKEFSYCASALCLYNGVFSQVMSSNDANSLATSITFGVCSGIFALMGSTFNKKLALKREQLTTPNKVLVK